MQPLTEQPQYSSQDHPLAIHIGKVLEEKAGKRLPPFVLRLLERIIHQREINDILYRYGHLDGMDFLEALMGEFAVTTEWVHPERLPESGRCIFVCNHPLGGMDGISLSYMLGKRYGDVRYMVTDFLYYLRPLQSVFLPVNNRQGSQGRVPLGDEADALIAQARELLVTQRVQVCAVQPHVSCRRREDAGEHVRQGALSATGVPGNDGQLAFLQADIQRVDGREEALSPAGSGEFFRESRCLDDHVIPLP